MDDGLWNSDSEYNEADFPEMDLPDAGSYLRQCGGSDGSSRPLVYLAHSMTNATCSEARHALLAMVRQTITSVGYDVYDPADYTTTEILTPSEVFHLDRREVHRADVIFFVRDDGSLGMGIEAQLASNALLMWVDARPHERASKATPLLNGLVNQRFLDGRYKRFTFEPGKLDELAAQIEEAFSDEALRARVYTNRESRSQAISSIEAAGLGICVRTFRLARQVSLADLARRTGIDPLVIRNIELDSAAASHLTLRQFANLLHAADLRLSMQKGGEGLFAISTPARRKSTLWSNAEEIARQSAAAEGRMSQAITDNELLSRFRRMFDLNEPEPVDVRSASVASVTRPLIVYISCPVSGLTDMDRKETRYLCKQIESAFKSYPKCDFEIHFPEQHPDDYRREFEDELYLNTIRRVASSDLGVVLPHPPATGVGMAASMMSGLCVPWLIVCPENRRVSRMLAGMYSIMDRKLRVLGSHTSVEREIHSALDKNLPHILASIEERWAIGEAMSCNSVGAEIETYLTQFYPDGRIPEHIDDQLLNLTQSLQMRPEVVRHLVTVRESCQAQSLLQFVHFAQTVGWPVNAKKVVDSQLSATVFVPRLAAPSCREEWRVVRTELSEFAGRLRGLGSATKDMMGLDKELDRLSRTLSAPGIFDRRDQLYAKLRPALDLHAQFHQNRNVSQGFLKTIEDWIWNEGRRRD